MAKSTSAADSRRGSYQLQVNAYDRTATLLVSLLVLTGLAVAGLCVVFFANKFRTRIEPIMVVPVEATSANANQGLAEEPEPPGVEEAPDLSEPQLQTALEALSAVSDTQAIVSDETADATAGEGLGDNRPIGPGGDGVIERVPRWERWKFRFEPKSMGDFTAWLDQYKIMVGVLGRDNQVHVASEFSRGTPQVAAGGPEEYARYGRTIPADGPMPALVRQLATRSGIADKGRYSLLFFPFEVEALLYSKEQEHSGGRSANEIRQTIFTVLERRGEYVFEVIDQKYF